MATQKIKIQYIDTTGSTTGQVLTSAGSGNNAYWGSAASGGGGNGYTGSAGAGYTGSLGYTGSSNTYNIVPYYSFSTQFNGSSQYLSIPNSTALNLAGGSWTIECWFYTLGDYSIYRTLFAKRVSGTGTTAWEIYLAQTSGYIGFYNGTLYTSTTLPSANVWHHCAAVYDGTNINIYLDGTRVYQSAVTNTDISAPIYIASAGTATEFFYGYISNLRVVKGVAVYTGAFTPPTTALTATQSSGTNIAAVTGTQTSLLTCQSAGFVDNSTNNAVISNNGNAVNVLYNPFATTSSPALSFQNVNISGSVTVSNSTGVAGQALISSGNNNPYWASIAPMYNYSAQFTGSNYITASSIAFGTSNFTIEWWMRSTETGDKRIMSNAPTETWGANKWVMGWGATSAGQVGLGINNGSFNCYTVGASLNNGSWHHVAMVRNGATFTIFVDGVSNITGNISTISLDGGNASPFAIGSGTSTDTKYTGYISNLRVVIGVAVYTGTFTPAGPLATTQIASVNISAITGTQTSLLTCNALTLTDSSANALPVTNTSAVVSSATTYPPVFTANTVAVSTTAISSVRQQFTGDGSTTVYTIAGGYTPNTLSVFVNGVMLRNGGDVTATNGATITFAIAPANTALIDVVGNVPTTYSSITPQGYSVQFAAASSQYLTNSNAAFSFGTGDFTIECWAYPTLAPATNWTPIMSVGFAWNAQLTGREIRIGQNVNNLGYGYVIPNNTNASDVYSSNGTLALNTWHHLALVRNSSTVSFYRNGGLVASTTGVSFNFTQTNVYIGADPWTPAGDGYFTGYISNVRIVKGLAVYTGAFTPPQNTLTAVQSAVAPSISAITGTQTSLLTCNAPTIIDGSTNALTITNNGTALVSTAVVPIFTTVTINNSGYTGSAGAGYTGSGGSGYTGSAGAGYTGSGGSGYTGSAGAGYTGSAGSGYTGSAGAGYTGSAGTNGYTGSTGAGYTGSAATIAPGYTYSAQFTGASSQNLLLPGSTALDFAGGDFTIEFWAYITGTGHIVNRGGGSNIAWSEYEIYAGGSNLIYWAASLANTGYDIGGENATGVIGTYTNSAWNHIAVTRSGNVYRGFVNGVQGYTQTIAGSLYAVSTTRGLAIGSNYTNTWGSNAAIANPFSGFISNLRIVKGTAVYTAAFTVPTSPLTAITNTVLLTCNTITLSDSSTNLIQITNNNGVTTTATFSPFASTTVSIPTAALTAVRQQFVGDGSTTVFAIAGGYTPNAISVYYNGLKLRNGSDVTVTNGSTITFAVAPVNTSLIDVTATVPTTYSSITPVSYSVGALNGSSQYLTVGAISDFKFLHDNTTDWTVEAWVNPSSIALGDTTVISTAITSGNIGASIALNGYAGGDIYVYLCRGAAGYATAYGTTTAVLTANIWQHIAVTFTSSTKTFAIYVNGVSRTLTTRSTETSSAFAYSSSNPSYVLAVGRYQAATPAGYFSGYISNLRIVKSNVYTNNFTVPSSPLAITQSASGAYIQAITGTQTSLLTCNGPTIIDGSTNAFTITNNGSTPVSTSIVPTFTNVTITGYTAPYTANYLIVAGGGGGGNSQGGGAGAGGFLPGYTALQPSIVYTIIVGAGGLGSTGASVAARAGNDSSITGTNILITATGGGAGAEGSTAAGNGGSGGGGAGTGGGGGASGLGITGQGFPGTSTGTTIGGGGGGATAAGSGANGGAGAVSNITGTYTYYAGGGGGNTGGSGGAGGGGAAGVNGTANTGGGGGANNGSTWGTGGSGIVILSIPTANYSGTTTGSPTVTTNGLYKVLKFTASGSYTA